MTSRQRIRALIARTPADRTGFWLGNPHPDTWPILHRYFGTGTEEELRLKLRDDFRWLTPQYLDGTYRHPEGRRLFDVWKHKKSLGEAGPLALSETEAEVGSYEWPDARYVDPGPGVRLLQEAGDHYRASGFWMPFFHDVTDLFGMENYMVNLIPGPPWSMRPRGTCASSTRQPTRSSSRQRRTSLTASSLETISGHSVGSSSRRDTLRSSSSIPTLILFKNGQIQGQMVGVNPKSSIVSLVQKIR